MISVQPKGCISTFFHEPVITAMTGKVCDNPVRVVYLVFRKQSTEGQHDEPLRNGIRLDQDQQGFIFLFKPVLLEQK